MANKQVGPHGAVVFSLKNVQRTEHIRSLNAGALNVPAAKLWNTSRSGSQGPTIPRATDLASGLELGPACLFHPAMDDAGPHISCSNKGCRYQPWLLPTGTSTNELLSSQSTRPERETRPPYPPSTTHSFPLEGVPCPPRLRTRPALRQDGISEHLSLTAPAGVPTRAGRGR